MLNVVITAIVIVLLSATTSLIFGDVVGDLLFCGLWIVWGLFYFRDTDNRTDEI